MKGYDRELYRWEQDYFLEQFVRDVCGISLAEREGRALREELEALTGRLLATGLALVHRDLQSQNIMIYGDEPVFIDFQGLRRGSLFYDLGSLLCDAYVSLTEEERNDLLRYAYELLKLDRDWTLFREAFHDGSAQRLMQALGAFGFLGLKKGKGTFLCHIPQGVENLCRMAAASGRLPRLLNLAEQCRKGVMLK
jgi:aminoglycoside/choline kinase family phosphotransferase